MKKFRQTALICVLLVTAAILLSGCGAEDPLCGAWAYIHDPQTPVLTLENNGKATFNGTGYTYTSDDERLKLSSGGETLEMRDNDVTLDVVRMQVKTALRGVMQEQLRRVTIAYEPVWAIGTGYTATAEQANEVNSCIREVLRSLYGARAARAVSILYGGSMNTANAAELLAQPDVDGGLIGGASLKTESFEDIIEAANQA